MSNAKNLGFLIRKASFADIPSIVNIAKKKMIEDATHVSSLWKPSDSVEKLLQERYIKILESPNSYTLVAQSMDVISGFIAGQALKSKRVYDSDGMSLIVEDLQAEPSQHKDDIIVSLINAMVQKAKVWNIKNLLIINSMYNKNVARNLEDCGFKSILTWYHKSI